MDFFQWVSTSIKNLLNSFFNLLPQSPVIYLSQTSQIKTLLGYINWFCPVYLWLSILENWLLAVLLWYAIQIALRWVKAIE